MRNITLSLLGLIACATTATAQEVKFGVKTGVNFANLPGLDNTTMKIGFHIGAVAEIKFNEKFSIQPEVIYSAQGAKYSLAMFPTGTIEGKIKNNYINVPIMAKYYIVESFSVELGPQVGFLMKSEEKDNTVSYKSVDFGLGVGLAYELPMGFFVGARYNLGLSKVNEDFVSVGNGLVEIENQKNSVFQVSVGFKF